MRIYYKTDSLEKNLEIKSRRDKKYKELSDKIKQRIDALKAVQNLSYVPIEPPIRRHKLKGDFNGCFAVMLNKKDRLVFKPVGQFNNEDISTISEIMIIFLGDYH